MKFIKLLLFTAILLVFGTSCKKYLEKEIPDQFSDNDFWTGESNVRTYNWGFYDLFTGFGTGTTGDFYFSTFTDDQAATSFQNFAISAPATNSAWNFSYIRKANIMLERIPQVPMTDEAKNHWRGVARFFRAMDYFKKVQTFGDMPWIGKSLDVSESNLIYKPRDPRVLVMDSVLADVNFAIANMRVKDLDNTVNKNVALALKSRICLYEGTYRKYHTELALPDADKFLLEAKNASEQLMASTYVLGDYKALYSSMDLSSNKEVILHKKYIAGAMTHSVIGYTNSTTRMHGLTKSAVESYVATDGLPISQSPLYLGDASIKTLRANRDKRLLTTIDTFLTYDGNLVNGLSSSTGYRPSKFLQPASSQLAPFNETDAPLFWLAEVYLNYAEACAELTSLGKYAITQGDLDNSINRLRTRAGVAKLEVAGNTALAAGVVINDTKRDADVSPIIWEIRRERRVELMMDGFRFMDLMRWKKGEYLDSSKNPDSFLGAKVPVTSTIVRKNALGYIMPYTAATSRIFISPKHYLSAIPTGQISLYPGGELKQNQDW